MIRIIIADDQMLIREGLGTILNMEDGIEVVGLACNGEEACELTEKLTPDIVMMDIQMPVMDGLTAIKHIKRKLPNTLILILSTYLEDKYIVEGLASGASGYLLKDMEVSKMIAAIRDVVDGQYVLMNSVATKLADHLTKLTNEKQSEMYVDSYTELTEREQELALLLMEGYSNRDIAIALHIAEGTVRNKISIIYSKLNVTDRVQAVVKLQSIIKS